MIEVQNFVLDLGEKFVSIIYKLLQIVIQNVLYHCEISPRATSRLALSNTIKTILQLLSVWRTSLLGISRLVITVLMIIYKLSRIVIIVSYENSTNFCSIILKLHHQLLQDFRFPARQKWYYNHYWFGGLHSWAYPDWFYSTNDQQSTALLSRITN